MASRSTFTVPGDIPERTSWRYTCTLKDDLDQPIPAAALTSLLLTLYVRTGGNPIINSVDHVNILNLDRGSVGTSDGSLTIRFHAADTPILIDSATSETHVALLQGTYNGGQDGFNREIVHRVTNLARVT